MVSGSLIYPELNAYYVFYAYCIAIELKISMGSHLV
jgi:hypothetical protein